MPQSQPISFLGMAHGNASPDRGDGSRWPGEFPGRPVRDERPGAETWLDVKSATAWGAGVGPHRGAALQSSYGPGSETLLLSAAISKIGPYGFPSCGMAGPIGK